MSASIPIPEGSVVITPFQMYQEQQEMNKTLGAVSSKLDAVVTKLDHSQEDQSKRMDAIDGKDGEIAQLKTRVSSLERWRWKSAGVVAVVSAVGAGGGTALIMRAVIGH